MIINEILKEDNLAKAIRTTLQGNNSDYANRLLAKIDFFANELKEIIGDTENYKNSKMINFTIFEPKKRNIECFTIKDRIIHKAIWSIVNPILEKNLVKTTYACIKGRGGFKASKDLFNHIKKNPEQYYLKVDVESYFTSVHKPTLFRMLRKQIKCSATMHLLKVIMFYNSDDRGIPIGSVLSQTFGNFYLSKLDNQLARMGVKFWRYMDDIIVVSESKDTLKEIFRFIDNYLKSVLKIQLNDRTVINKVSQGINFVGYIHYPTHVRMKKVTAVRIKKRITQENKHSYFGFLMHGNNYKLLSMYKEKLDESSNRTENNIEAEEQRQDKPSDKLDNDQWSLF